MCTNVNIEKIKSERESRNWTQQQLADVCGVNLRTIQRIEKSGVASRESLASLCSAFDLEKTEALLLRRAHKNYGKFFFLIHSFSRVAKVLYAHALIIFSTFLLILGVGGLVNSNIDSRAWLLIACIWGSGVLLTTSLLRKSNA